LKARQKEESKKTKLKRKKFMEKKKQNQKGVSK
jgi:hypothetical protein